MSELDHVENQNSLIEAIPNWKPKALILGAAIGTLAGLGAAYLFIQNVTDDNEPPHLTAGKGLKIGLLILGLVRNIADMA